MSDAGNRCQDIEILTRHRMMKGSRAWIYYSLAQSRYSYISASHMSQITLPCFRLITWESSSPFSVTEACKNMDKIALCYRLLFSLLSHSIVLLILVLSLLRRSSFLQRKEKGWTGCCFLIMSQSNENLLESTFCVVHLGDGSLQSMDLRFASFFPSDLKFRVNLIAKID